MTDHDTTAINDNPDDHGCDAVHDRSEAMSETTTTYPAWPTEPPTAAELIRYSAGRGYWLMGRTWGLMDWEHAEGSTPLSMAQHMAWSVEMIHHHDTVLLLQLLAKHDQQAADDAAVRIWTAADAGDSYGEWLWQWAKEAGLDPDAIYANGEAAGFDNGRAIAPSSERENGRTPCLVDDDGGVCGRDDCPRCSGSSGDDR